MTVDTFEISDEQVINLLQLHEGHFYELKRKEIKPSKLSQTISAFANTDGGDIYIGIGDNKNKDGTKKRFWNGFDDIELANGHLQTIHEFFPFQQYFSLAFLKNNKKKGYVLHVQIHKTKEITKASDGNPYVRRGAQNIPIKSQIFS